ncbi:hypothetical protein [Cellvibrio sp. pealriver]|uniref:hypothetical protein n=1 Tax=Cellvibrio sp. pealriver TaxID=1622269 RepID=UPI00066FD41E|nr:hypothetical protein [Cellvibrio sp. pealriver]
MNIDVKVTPHGDYLHIEVRGIGNYENAVAFWQQVAHACEAHQCFKVLGEQYLLDSVTTLEAFDHPAIFKKVGITTKYKFAWVDKNPRTRETTQFVYDVLASRSISFGKMFNDINLAKEWLLSKS